ncbi:Probable cysteine desulfurase [Dermatophilus congolensis]|uniref:cysteine desulfurase n=1 Tax=Dermatophilus congolensis TaxID=1863 RepID=A0AA46H0E1_9MICO|nr:SufS family cysteine desulfurase [Dermatophilus congolensis]STD09112.1 Probable cysteine desulfurase [Dermatophilus congolensis]
MTSTFTQDDLVRIRADFPELARTVRGGRQLVYLDSGATSLKPQVVIDAESDYYAHYHAAVHRGAHAIAEEATEAYEQARATIAGFVGAEVDEIVFTRNATESINLVAYALSNAVAPGALDGVEESLAARLCVGPGDEIVITEMEHHANLVPWQELCRRTGATLRWVTFDDSGRIPDEAWGEVLSERTKLVSLTQVSNVLATRNDVAAVAAKAHAVGALVLVDAAQSVPHMAVDVRSLGADFVAFTGHKMLGPLGIGVLWGRRELLAAMPPYTTGGSMIELVRMEKTTYLPPPTRFEAGTPVVSQSIALAAAARYLCDLGMDKVEAHDQELMEHALEVAAQRPWMTVLGPLEASDRVGALAFTVKDVHPHDVAQILDDSGVAVRSGHHCAGPLHRKLGVTASTRASFSVYTTHDEIDAWAAALDRIPSIFGVSL